MNKLEFCNALRAHLVGVSEADALRSVEFYCEMIDDRTEEGMSEEEAVAAIGAPDAIAQQILMELPLSKLLSARIKPHHLSTTQYVLLLVLASPLWLSLLAVFAAILISVYAVIWALVISYLCIVVSLLAGGVAGVFATGVFLLRAKTAPALFLLGGSLICAGLGTLFACFTRGVLRAATLLSKQLLRFTKRILIGRRKKA